MSVKTVRRACQPSTVCSTKSNTLITHWSENMEPAKETCETPWSQPEGITSSAEATSDWIQKIFISVSYIELWNGSARFPGNTSSGVILRHLLELAPAAWHTAYARHQQSSARWKHTDGQSGLILKQTTQIYLFTMRLMRTSFYYAFNAHFLTTSWQPYACLNSQNYHPPHGTPSFMAFPTYKLGCDRRYIPMVSMINSTSCQSTLSSTSPWHTADRIDFLFSGHLLMLLVSSAQLPAPSQISWFSSPKPRLAQNQQHKQQQQQQQTKQQTKQQTIAKPFQNLSGLGFGWLQF